MRRDDLCAGGLRKRVSLEPVGNSFFNRKRIPAKMDVPQAELNDSGGLWRVGKEP